MSLTSYPSLGDKFYASSTPDTFPKPELMFWNEGLADELQLMQCAAYSEANRAAFFSGQRAVDKIEPVALAYSGHQFGQFVPSLGDGRAHLIGELTDSQGQLREIQLKGSGRTPFSRGGDGLCALGPAIREFIMSEALHALNVPTCRSLAVVLTGAPVVRDSLQAGAVVTRVASSHIRVGTFQYFASRNWISELEKLMDFTIERHFNDPKYNFSGLTKRDKALLFLECAMEKHIAMVCHWLRVGFIHGVMNTDNAPLPGETIDFGPCAMLGAYNPDAVFSSIDRNGRYAFAKQPDMAQWNMARLAECLIPFVDTDSKKSAELLTEVIQDFAPAFQTHHNNMMANKLGIHHFQDSDQNIIASLFSAMQSAELDYTITFDTLTRSIVDQSITLPSGLKEFETVWRNRIGAQQENEQETFNLMRAANPVIIPRNHLVEKVISDCVEQLSAEPAQAFIKALASPYDNQHLNTEWYQASKNNDSGYKTYCGT